MHVCVCACVSVPIRVCLVCITVGRTKSLVTLRFFFSKSLYVIGIEFQMMILLNRHYRTHKCVYVILLLLFCNFNIYIFFFFFSNCHEKCSIARSVKCKEKQMLTNTNIFASTVLPRQRRDDQQVEVKKNVSTKIKEFENG